MALSGADPGAVVAGPADRHDRKFRRDGLRSDARRTAEYLAFRGLTPIEAVHDVVKMGWKQGTRVLAKELGLPKAEAFRLWMKAAEALLPFTAARLDALDLGAAIGAAGAAGVSGLAHLLAATEFSRELARDRAALPGAVSHDGRTIDSAEIPGLGSDITERSGSANDTLSQLPPRSSD